MRCGGRRHATGGGRPATSCASTGELGPLEERASAEVLRSADAASWTVRVRAGRWSRWLVCSLRSGAVEVLLFCDGHLIAEETRPMADLDESDAALFLPLALDWLRALGER